MEKNHTNSEVNHIKVGNVEYLSFKALEKYNKNIHCIVTLRHGGVSKTPYSSLNFKFAEKELKENVLKNLEIICNKTGISKAKVYKGSQNHTDNILYITDENKEKYEFEKRNEESIDGYITDKKDISTLVTTADCNAIIIYDTKNNAYANLHSGWRGTVKKIYITALEQMKNKFNTNAKDVIVCVSPSIQKCCFSSEDENFKKIFTDIWKDEENYIYFETKNPKRFHIDLAYVIKKELINYGVREENIHFAGICTCCNNDDFFSYRAKLKKKEEDFGLMATICTLK